MCAAEGRPTVLYCAADLIWATRIKWTAEALGVAARPVRNPEMLSARLGDTRVAGLLVDLETGKVGLSLIERVRSAENGGAEGRVPIIAWGPHVEVELLDRARAAGADRVLARGAFHRGLADLLVQLAGGEGGANPPAAPNY